MIAVSFDFWNTLFADGQESLRKSARQKKFLDVANRYKVVTPEAVEAAFRVSTDFFLVEWQKNNRTPLSLERIELMADFLKIELCAGDAQEIKEYFCNQIVPYPPLRIENVHTVIGELAKYFPLGIISDTGFIVGQEIKTFLEQENLLHHFSSMLFSDEFGRSKPHYSVFESTAKCLGVNPENLIHVGDLENTDIKGANDFGATSICFTGANPAYAGNNSADYEINNYKDLYTKIVQIAEEKMSNTA